MLPYLIAGAIGFGIGKLFEEGGETFGRGGMTKKLAKTKFSYDIKKQDGSFVVFFMYDDIFYFGVKTGFDTKEEAIKYAKKEIQELREIVNEDNTYFYHWKSRMLWEQIPLGRPNSLGVFNSRQQAEKVISKRIEMRMKQPAQKRFSHLKFNDGGEVQDELYDLVSDFDSNEYEAFCYEFDIDIDDANQMTDFISQLSDEDAKNIINQIENGYFSDSEDEYDIGGEIIGERKSDMTPIYKFFREESEYETLNYKGEEYDFDLIFGFHNGGIDSESGNELPSGYYARIDPLGIGDTSTKHILKKNDFEYSFVGELWNLTMLILKAEEDTKENKNQAIKIFEEKRTDLINEFKEYINDYVLGTYSEYAEGGEAKKRRRRANKQTGRTDRSVDKTRVGKPVGYRFTNSLASKLRKDQYAVPTEKQITKYLGKGIYKENRKNRSDRDRTAKL
jgi:hypothetical protein